MLVNRRTFIVKRGKMDAAIALMLAEFRRSGSSGRVYVPEVGPFDVLAVEGEFADFAAYDQFWSTWAKQPETGSFMEQWYAVTEIGGTNEIWRLAE